MPTITVGGLATGLDTNTMIDQLVALERRAVDLIVERRAAVSDQQTAYQSLNTKLLALKGALSDMRDPTRFLVKSATSSNESVLTVSAGDGATSGTTTITVSALAKAAIAASGVGKSASTDAIASGSGTFEFRLGSGSTQTVNIDATTTLSDLATAINDLSAGVTASVVNLGTSASPDYRLQMVSNDTGASNDITIVRDDTDISITTTQNATNASFTVSGFASALSRETNTFDDVIPGVTVTLNTTGTAVVTVSNDVSAISSGIQNLVDKFNDIVNFVSSESLVTQDSESSDRETTIGPLAADGTARGIVERLHDLIASQISGLSGSYSSLSQVGIKTERDGTLTFDSSKLSSAVASDAVSVRELFAGTSSVDGVADRLYDYVNGLTQTGGIIDLREDALSDQIDSLDDQIESAERAVDAFEANLRATFANLEVLISGLQAQSTFLLNTLLKQG